MDPKDEDVWPMVGYHIFDFSTGRKCWIEPDLISSEQQVQGLVSGSQISIWTGDTLLEDFPVTACLAVRVAGQAVIIATAERLLKKNGHRCFKLTFPSGEEAINFASRCNVILRANQTTEGERYAEVPERAWNQLVTHAMSRIFGSSRPR